MFERCLYFNVNALARAVNQIWDEVFARFDLSPSHAYCLRAVLAQPGSRQQDLADELKLSRSTLTRFVQSLEKKGLVWRAESANDKRGQCVYPTDTATALQAELETTGNALYARMKQTVGTDHLPDLVADLRATREQLINGKRKSK